MPTTQTFGCSRTRCTNAFSPRVRFANSAALYTVGLTGRPRASAARSSAPNRSPYVRWSLRTCRSNRDSSIRDGTAGAPTGR